MDALQWAVDEFSDADLGDLRRTNRLVHIAAKLVGSAECSLSQAMANQADNKGAQRLFGSDAFDYQDIAEASISNTVAKVNKCDRVLLIQDTTHFNFDHHPATTGLGHIGSTADRSFLGIMAHWTLALDQAGESLGLASLKLWNRVKDPRKTSLNAHQNKPIEQKESYKWLEAVNELADRLSERTQIIWVADREADIYELIDLIKNVNHDFVIRCNNDRVISDEEDLLKTRIREAPVLGEEVLTLTRKGKTFSLSVTIQSCTAGLISQRRKGNAKSGKKTLDQEISVVRVAAKNPKDNFEWILLTTLEAESLAECLDIVWTYKQRWHIELIHKTLKTGFQAEDVCLDEAEKLENLLAVMFPCAIQVYWLAYKRKYEPDTMARNHLSSMEIMLLKRRNKVAQTYEPTLKEAWLWIAYMGGFRGSKNSKPPGQMTFWRGYSKLSSMAQGAEIYAASLEIEKCVH